MADPEQEWDRGLALRREGKFRQAAGAFQHLIDSGDPNWVARGRIEWGAIMWKQGEIGQAQAAFEQALASGHPDWSPCAAWNLGLLQRDQNQLSAAVAAFQQAAAAGHQVWSPNALLELGALLMDAGDPPRARQALEAAIASGHRDVAPAAMYNLGVLCDKKEGDASGARDAYQAAIESLHAEWAPKAANNLGVLLQRQGDVAGARQAYQQAISSGHTRFAPMAQNNLRLLEQHADDPTQIETTIQQGTWTLRQGEQVLLDVNLLIPATTKSKLNVSHRIAQGQKVGLRVIITNQRIRLGDAAFDYAEVSSVKYDTWDPITQTGAYRVRHPRRREFVISSKNGSWARAEFADNFANNPEVWTKLVAAAQQAIEPRLQAERDSELRAHRAEVDRVVSELIDRLREGETRAFAVQSDDVSALELSREGCTVVGLGREMLPWSTAPQCERRIPRLRSNYFEVSALDDRGKRVTRAKIRNFDEYGLCIRLLERCPAEFTTPMSDEVGSGGGDRHPAS